MITRKITLAAARIAQGKQDKLCLSNLSSLRDWGYAKDYVECMWLILQNKTPRTLSFATGEQHSVRGVLPAGLPRCRHRVGFTGGARRRGIDQGHRQVVIEVSPTSTAPPTSVNLWGDPNKAKRELGWNPPRRRSRNSSGSMVDHDMKREGRRRARRGSISRQTLPRSTWKRGVIK